MVGDIGDDADRRASASNASGRRTPMWPAGRDWAVTRPSSRRRGGRSDVGTAPATSRRRARCGSRGPSRHRSTSRHRSSRTTPTGASPLTSEAMTSNCRNPSAAVASSAPLRIRRSNGWRAGARPHVGARQQDADHGHDRQVRAVPEEPPDERRSRGRPHRRRQRSPPWWVRLRAAVGRRLPAGVVVATSGVALTAGVVIVTSTRPVTGCPSGPTRRHRIDTSPGCTAGSGVTTSVSPAAPCTEPASSLRAPDGVDEGDRQRVERYRLVEHPHDLGRCRRQRGAVSRVARNERVVRQYASPATRRARWRARRP